MFYDIISCSMVEQPLGQFLGYLLLKFIIINILLPLYAGTAIEDNRTIQPLL